MHDGRLAPRQHQPPLTRRGKHQHRDHGHEKECHHGIEPVVEDEARRIGRPGAHQRRRMRQESELRIGREHLLVSRSHRDHDDPDERCERHPQVTLAPHLDQNRRRDAQRDGREQLIRDAEQRPQ